jgi:transposase
MAVVAKKVKQKEHEKLSEANIKRVIELLEAQKPITKKEACEALNISYNTTRLAKIIDNFKNEEAETARRRAANRGKPAAEHEIQLTIERYLDGDSVSEIAKSLYRPTSLIKEIIEKVGVPQKVVGADYFHPGIIPDPCIRENFAPGDIVWSARRHCMAIVLEQKHSVSDPTNNYYSIYIIEPIEETSTYFPSYSGYGGYYAGSYAYDLGSLDHLKQYGVDVYRPYRTHFPKWLKGK